MSLRLFIAPLLVALIALTPVARAADAPQAQQTIGIHPVLGVQIDTNAQTDGLLVDAVLPQSIASKMGLAPGDILLKLNGTVLSSSEVFHNVLSLLKHGDKLELLYRHGSQNLVKKDSLQEVPVLPTYEIVEGKGIPGVVEVGFTREQLEKSLGKPLGEQERDEMIYLAYPFHGLTIALLKVPPEAGPPRVVQFSIEYPLVGRTSRGLLTIAPTSEVASTYSGETIDLRAMPNGLTVQTLPQLGIQFRSMNAHVTRVAIIPKVAPSPSPSP